jgi:hypothetical protein
MDHTPQPPASLFPSNIMVNVVISGHVVIEFLSTTVTDNTEAAKALSGLTAGLAAPTADLMTAVETNPVPTP